MFIIKVSKQCNVPKHDDKCTILFEITVCESAAMPMGIYGEQKTSLDTNKFVEEEMAKSRRH